MASPKPGDRFWSIVCSDLSIELPVYLKNLLRIMGFDNQLSMRTLTSEDITRMEQFVKTKILKFIKDGENPEDYYGNYVDCPNDFEIQLGHQRLLLGITDYVSKKPSDYFSKYMQLSDKSSNKKGNLERISAKCNQKGFLVGLVLGFSYLTGSGKEREYSKNSAPTKPPKKSARGLGVLCNWYTWDLQGTLRVVDMHAHGYFDIKYYRFTIPRPEVKSNALTLTTNITEKLKLFKS